MKEVQTTNRKVFKFIESIAVKEMDKDMDNFIKNESIIDFDKIESYMD